MLPTTASVLGPNILKKKKKKKSNTPINIVLIVEKEKIHKEKFAVLFIE